MRICLEKLVSARELTDLLKVMTHITMHYDFPDLLEGLDWWEVRFFRMGGIGSEYRKEYVVSDVDRICPNCGYIDLSASHVCTPLPTIPIEFIVGWIMQGLIEGRRVEATTENGTFVEIVI